MDTVNAIGRRKSAVARVYVNDGAGKITINKREFENYFTVPEMKNKAKYPLTVLGVEDKYDINVNLSGGGYKGQAEALSLAIARALIKINAEDKSVLRAKGLVTRNPKKVERKKPGQPKARKKFQFSKR